jgi:integrase
VTDAVLEAIARRVAALVVDVVREPFRLLDSHAVARMLSVERVNEKRAAEGRMLLPARVTPHTLRRTFASLCFSAGRDLRWVMGQLGHEDPRMTLAVYAQCMKRSQIDEAVVWQLMRFTNEPEDLHKRGFGPTNGPMTAQRLQR